MQRQPRSPFVPALQVGTQGTVTSSPFPSCIQRNELHVCCVTGEDLDDVEIVRQNEVHLCDSERVRAQRFHLRQDRHRFVIGRGMLRRALGAYLSTDPRDIVFSHNRYGRPGMASPGPKPINFNVSHTDGIVVTAFAFGSEVGIDAERICANFPHLEVARRHFPPSKYADLERLPPSLRPARFCEYWVVLEAYAKGRGMGLSLSLADVIFKFDETDPSAIYFTAAADAQSQHWRFWLMAPSPEHRLAVAGLGAIDRLVVRRLRSKGLEKVELPLLACDGTPDASRRRDA